MLPRYRRAAILAVPVVLIAAGAAVLASSARAGTAVADAQPNASCQGHSGGSSSCSISQQLSMPLSASIVADASPGQGQHATVSWTLSCSGSSGAATSFSGSSTGAVPFRARIRVPGYGGSNCSLAASASLSGGIVNAGLYYTLGSQVMISLPTGDTRPGAPLAYFKCLTDKNNSGRPGAQVVIGGCGSIYANTWYYDGTHLRHGGLCLTDPGNGGNRTRLVLERCTRSADQAWQYRQPASQQFAQLVLKARGGRMCLDDPKYSARSGTQLALFTCNGGDSQGWTISNR